MGQIMADTDNVRGGAKDTIDCLLLPNEYRAGIGIIQDDSPKYLVSGTTEDRPRRAWNSLPGPGTWLILRGLTDG
jgi:hypothetical protein